MIPVDVDGDGDMVRLSLIELLPEDATADYDFAFLHQDLIVCTRAGSPTSC